MHARRYGGPSHPPTASGSGTLAATGSDDPSHVARGRTWLTCATPQTTTHFIWQLGKAEAGLIPTEAEKPGLPKHNGHIGADRRSPTGHNHQGHARC